MHVPSKRGLAEAEWVVLSMHADVRFMFVIRGNLSEAFQDRLYNSEREAGGDGHVKDREHDWNKLRIDTKSWKTAKACKKKKKSCSFIAAFLKRRYLRVRQDKGRQDKKKWQNQSVPKKILLLRLLLCSLLCFLERKPDFFLH